MGFVNTFTAGGQGTLDLGGVQLCNEVSWYIVTLADLAVPTGTAPVRRIHHQAFWALTFTPTGGPTTGIVIARKWGFVGVEAESHIFPSTDLVEADTLYFDVQPGGVMYFEVDW